MHRLALAAAVFAASVLSAGAAAPGSAAYSPATRTICVDVGGQTRPAVCQATASRLDGRDDICQCPIGRRVEAPVCGPHQRPPADSRAVDQVRKLASQDGSLVGDLFRGRPMCIAPRNRQGAR